MDLRDRLHRQLPNDVPQRREAPGVERQRVAAGHQQESAETRAQLRGGGVRLGLDDDVETGVAGGRARAAVGAVAEEETHEGLVEEDAGDVEK